MNARQIATGTVLAASLSLGGSAVADAGPGLPMDRFEVPCDQMERRLDRLQHQQSLLEARRVRLEARLEQAVVDGNQKLARRLRIQLRQVDRAEARLATAVSRLSSRYATHCAPADQT